MIIYVKGSVIEREKEGCRGRNRKTEIFYQLVHSINDYNGWGWAILKPGAKNSVIVYHMSGRGSQTWAIFCCFLRGTSTVAEQSGLEPLLI